MEEIKNNVEDVNEIVDNKFEEVNNNSSMLIDMLSNDIEFYRSTKNET